LTLANLAILVTLKTKLIAQKKELRIRSSFFGVRCSASAAAEAAAVAVRTFVADLDEVIPCAKSIKKP